MLDLAGADAEGERAKRAMRRGVAVAADQGRAGQGEALLRPDDMDDALLGGEIVDIGDAELGDVALQRRELGARSAGSAIGRRLPSAPTRFVVGRL